MNLIVLDRNLDSLSIMDNYTSFIWTDRFQECGDFELCLPVNKGTFDFIKKDHYLWSEHSDHLMIIEKITIDSDEEDGKSLIVTGRSLESILDRRIIWGLRTLSGNLQEELRAVFNENIISPSKPERKIDNFVFEVSDDPIITSLVIERQYIGDSLYDIVTNLCTERGIGFKVIPNDKKQFVFSLYSGADRSYSQTKYPYVVFSPNFDNIINSTYLETNSDYKNVTLVGGEGEGSARRYTAVGNVSGLDRREIFTDAGSVSSDISDDITESFNFSQYPSQAFNNTTKAFVSDPLFNSCMINVSAYAGRKISLTIPNYTGSDGQTSKYATILVNSAKKYVSTLQAWERYDDNEETVDRGGLKTYEIKLPEDAEYLYTSMYTQKAIDDEIFQGALTDFNCETIKLSNDEYIQLMRQSGKETLAENTEEVSFEGQAESTVMFRYGEDFFIGDIVQVADEFGHEITSRVTEVILSEDESGNTIYPTFSTIVSTPDQGVLPDGYTELDYIQSDGGQYINTFFTPNNNTRIVLDVDILASNTAPIFGSRDDANLNSFILWVTSVNEIRFDYGSSVTSQSITNVKGRITIDVYRNSCTFGGVTFTVTAEKFQSSYNLALFSAIAGGTIENRRIKAKLYSCRIYDDDTLIRNYVPCINPSDLIGLYDTINQKFYPNSGTGVFTAGQKGVETV